MATDLQLDIVTPERGAFSGRVNHVILPAWDGQMGCYPNHTLGLVLLRGGVVTVSGANGDVRWVVGRGFAEIGADRVTMLTDLAEPHGQADAATARTQLDAAVVEVGLTADGTEKRRLAERTREIATARLSS